MPSRKSWLSLLAANQPAVMETALRVGTESRAPVDLARLERMFKVEIVTRPMSSRRGCGLLERNGDSWKIVVKADERVPGAISPRQRFSVAHEIAHMLFIESGLPPPSGKSEYWRLEDECNRVAGALIVPRWLLPDTPVAVGEGLSWVAAISARAAVSFAVAATEFVLATPNMLGAAMISHLEPTAPVVDWSYSSVSPRVLPASKKKLLPEDDLSGIVFRALASGQQETVDFGDAGERLLSVQPGPRASRLVAGTRLAPPGQLALL